MSLFQQIKQNQSSLALRAFSHDFFLFLPQIAKAYMKLMGTLTRLLRGLDHQDPYSLIDEIRAILLLEVDVVKVHKEIKYITVFIYRLPVIATQGASEAEL